MQSKGRLSLAEFGGGLSPNTTPFSHTEGESGQGVTNLPAISLVSRARQIRRAACYTTEQHGVLPIMQPLALAF